MMGHNTGSPPPVIIIGMHRSGTNLVTRFLMQLGLFMGWLRDGNSEAFYYQRRNEAIFSWSGAAWDNPGPLEAALRETSLTKAVVAGLAEQSRTGRTLLYWGPWQWARMKSGLAQRNLQWGWKDPRNTFTLSLWLELFPEAKVIHVVRNGVDIAASLRSREQRRLRTRKNPQHFSRRCLELAGGFSLWEEYVRRGLRHEQELGGRGLRIKYEDFLAEPLLEGAKVAEFLKLDTRPPRIKKAAAMINSDRGNAYRSDLELISFFSDVKSSPCMRVLGYGD